MNGVRHLFVIAGPWTSALSSFRAAAIKALHLTIFGQFNIARPASRSDASRMNRVFISGHQQSETDYRHPLQASINLWSFATREIPPPDMMLWRKAC
jgi:hypothetical protein